MKQTYKSEIGIITHFFNFWRLSEFWKYKRHPEVYSLVLPGFGIIFHIMMRFVIAKDAFNRKISLLTSKLNIELGKKLVTYHVWSIALYDSET